MSPEVGYRPPQVQLRMPEHSVFEGMRTMLNEHRPDGNRGNWYYEDRALEAFQAYVADRAHPDTLPISADEVGDLMQEACVLRVRFPNTFRSSDFEISLEKVMAGFLDKNEQPEDHQKFIERATGIYTKLRYDMGQVQFANAVLSAGGFLRRDYWAAQRMGQIENWGDTPQRNTLMKLYDGIAQHNNINKAARNEQFYQYVFGPNIAAKDTEVLEAIAKRVEEEPLELAMGGAGSGKPERRMREGVDVFSAILQEAAQLGSQNAKALHVHLGKLVNRHRPAHASVNLLANILTEGMNRSEAFGEGKLERLNPANPFHTPEAIARCLYAIFEMGDVPAELKAHQRKFEITAAIASQVFLAGAVGVRASIKDVESDLHFRFPGATQEVVKLAAADVRQGASLSEVAEKYRELNKVSGGQAGWKKWRRGYGLLS